MQRLVRLRVEPGTCRTMLSLCCEATPGMNSGLLRGLRRERFGLCQDFLQAHGTKALLSPVPVIKRLPADTCQKTQGLDRAKVLFEYGDPLCRIISPWRLAQTSGASSI